MLVQKMKKQGKRISTSYRTHDFKGTKNFLNQILILLLINYLHTPMLFTSHDTTGYVFDFPSQYWQEGDRSFADCMQNARFDEQMLNSEMKAVIQELKMYKDAHFSDLLEKMLQAIFLIILSLSYYWF